MTTPSKGLVRQPQSDTRRCSFLTLANGLRVTVVSDPGESSCAAALAVLAGSVHEPKERPGLAHYCEHMLLHGTLHFGDSSFAEYLKQHGGKHNAVTTVLQTCYAFQVQSERLEGALCRFARFFVAPVFSRSYEHQEVQAIDAEHSMNVTNDFRRQWAILLQDSNPKHPYHWTSGCSKSLLNPVCKHGLHEALESFHKLYKADRMSLAVVGNESTEVLEGWAKRYFSSIPSQACDLSRCTGDALGGDEPAFLSHDF